MGHPIWRTHASLRVLWPPLEKVNTLWRNMLILIIRPWLLWLWHIVSTIAEVLSQQLASINAAIESKSARLTVTQTKLHEVDSMVRDLHFTSQEQTKSITYLLDKVDWRIGPGVTIFVWWASPNQCQRRSWNIFALW